MSGGGCVTCRHADATSGLCLRLACAWERRTDAAATHQEPAGAPNAPRKHSHYFKDVSKLATVDVYRVLELFGVTDQAIGHAVKKLLCAGQRGAKDQSKDVQEAIDTLTRWQEMRAEDEGSK